MAMAATQASKALTSAESLHLHSLSATLFAYKPSLALVSSVSFPRPRLPRLCSSSLLPYRKTPPAVPLVAQTSEWALQDEDETVSAGLPDWPGEDEEAEAAGEGGFAEGEDESFSEPPEDAKLFVGNLPFEMDSEKLAQLFDKAGVVEVAEVIYNRETERSRGFGFVTMSTVEEAEKAVDMFHRYDVNGRLLTVNKAAPRGARVERTPREFESSFRIYVGNLPWQVDDSRLEQVFSEHGQVVDARVVYDRDSGRSRGFGFVKMSSQTEMDDAIAALDGQNLEGRALRVNVAEERPRRASF